MATRKTIRRIVTTTPSVSSWLSSSSSSQPLLPTLISIPPIPALSQWFLPNQSVNAHPPHRKLNIDHLTHSGTQDPLVCIEHTQTTITESSNSSSSFERLEIPWSYYLHYLDSPPQPPPRPSTPRSTTSSSPSSSTSTSTLYLAQCSPPPHLLPDLHLPRTHMDIPSSRLTHSSLWMGRTPTTTPMHQDPDHNLFLQICGHKTFRVMEPRVGTRFLELVRQGKEENGGGLSRLRGVEMMLAGPKGERDGLEKVVWDDDDVERDLDSKSHSDSDLDSGGSEQMEGEGDDLFQVTVQRGQGLLIPKGWWHAVRSRTGRDDGEEELSVSVNWWFR
ncbi:BQ2448_4226 [Microbotryum intermedium]|uniref:BQ2448_4226 protein n=1 Tax=Microbotryum intermedium TaxID=269621 RepID=A0A238FIR9_9BASI|nr:BQ2448_4226 [Microbotryum intermedium]